MNYFVIIACIVGVLQYLTYYVAWQLTNPLVAALLASLSGLVYTGGIHMDGLADIFDGFGANRDREKTLQIMKDSTCGTFGILALIVDVMIHFIGFYSLSEYPMLIILVPMSGKLAICSLAYIGKNIYEGLGALWIENIKGIGLGINTIIYTLIVWLITADILTVVGLLLLIGVGTYSLNQKYTKKLGGLNGDCLGATNQLIEWGVLVYLMICYV